MPGKRNGKAGDIFLTGEVGKRFGMTGLPELFAERMKELLGEEYEAFEASYGNERSQGLRANLLKGDKEQFAKLADRFGLRPVAWAEEGFYYDGDTRPGKSPYHEAGAYYIQEPSAMAVVELLAPEPGERVLDLCAAPGGKSSHAASRIRGEGLLVSNEIHPARARILSQNMERMGCKNGVTVCSDPAGLVAYFPGFFDRIIVDAPCSGEGMFRKDEEARTQWSPENVALCAARQQEILNCAAAMLRPGGKLVYSTCTFAPEEDEGAVERFLASHPEFSIGEGREVPGASQGRPQWVEGGREELSRTFRIWPHKADGEGHYLALLEKRGETDSGEDVGQVSAGRRTKRAEGIRMPGYCRDKALCKSLETMIREICPGAEWLRDRKEWILFGEQVYLLPEEMPDFSGLKVLRPGLHVATVRKGRLEPAHALAAALKEQEAARVCRLDEEQAKRYVGGETISQDGEKGWTLVTVDGYSLGWGKQAGGMIKNHYPKGLRRQL